MAMAGNDALASLSHDSIFTMPISNIAERIKMARRKGKAVTPLIGPSPPQVSTTTISTTDPSSTQSQLRPKSILQDLSTDVSTTSKKRKAPSRDHGIHEAKRTRHAIPNERPLGSGASSNTRQRRLPLQAVPRKVMEILNPPKKTPRRRAPRSKRPESEGATPTQPTPAPAISLPDPVTTPTDLESTPIEPMVQLTEDAIANVDNKSAQHSPGIILANKGNGTSQQPLPPVPTQDLAQVAAIMPKPEQKSLKRFATVPISTPPKTTPDRVKRTRSFKTQNLSAKGAAGIEPDVLSIKQQVQSPEIEPITSPSSPVAASERSLGSYETESAITTPDTSLASTYQEGSQLELPCDGFSTLDSPKQSTDVVNSFSTMSARPASSPNFENDLIKKIVSALGQSTTDLGTLQARHVDATDTKTLQSKASPEIAVSSSTTHASSFQVKSPVSPPDVKQPVDTSSADQSNAKADDETAVDVPPTASAFETPSHSQKGREAQAPATGMNIHSFSIVQKNPRKSSLPSVANDAFPTPDQEFLEKALRQSKTPSFTSQQPKAATQPLTEPATLAPQLQPIAKGDDNKLIPLIPINTHTLPPLISQHKFDAGSIEDAEFIRQVKECTRARWNGMDWNSKDWNNGVGQAGRICYLLDVGQLASHGEALFLSGEEAAQRVATNEFTSCPIITTGQQKLELQKPDQFLEELYDDDAKVFIQDPSIKPTARQSAVRAVTVRELKERFLVKTPGDQAWNCLELATHVEDGLRPAFLNNEDCRLLTKIKFPGNKDKASRYSYEPGWKEVEKWALLAQAGALTEPHQDSHGYSTYITVNHGLFGFGWLSNPTPEERKSWNKNPSLFVGGTWRYVVLRPGQTVYFPGGTIHFVFRHPEAGNTLAFGGHVLRCSQIARWARILIDEKKNSSITNEELTVSGPAYLSRVEKFVKQALASKTTERWGGEATCNEFLKLKQEFSKTKKGR